MANSLNYTASFIKSSGKLARVKPLFPYYHLDLQTRSRIIALGIRSRPRKYRRSRGGSNHFYKILSIISLHRKPLPLNKTQLRIVNNHLLCSLPRHAPEHHQWTQSYSYNGLLIKLQISCQQNRIYSGRHH